MTDPNPNQRYEACARRWAEVSIWHDGAEISRAVALDGREAKVIARIYTDDPDRITTNGHMVYVLPVERFTASEATRSLEQRVIALEEKQA